MSECDHLIDGMEILGTCKECGSDVIYDDTGTCFDEETGEEMPYLVEVARCSNQECRHKDGSWLCSGEKEVSYWIRFKKGFYHDGKGERTCDHAIGIPIESDLDILRLSEKREYVIKRKEFLRKEMQNPEIEPYDLEWHEEYLSMENDDEFLVNQLWVTYDYCPDCGEQL